MASKLLVTNYMGSTTYIVLTLGLCFLYLL